MSRTRFLVVGLAALCLLQAPAAAAAPITYQSADKINQTPVSADTPLPITIISGGGGGGSGTEYTEDAAAAANPVGGIIICRRRDTLSASEVSADLDNIALNCTAKGQAHVFAEIGGNLPAFASTPTVNLGTLNGAATSANQTTELGYLDGVEGFLSETHGVIGAATAPTKMGLGGGVYVSSAPTLTTGQSFAFRLDSHGSLVTTCANADGTLCGDISTVKTDQTTHGTTDLVAADITKVGGTAITAGAGNVTSGSPRFALGFPGGTQYNINISTATTTEIVPLSGSTVTYVLFDTLAANGTGDVTWKYGTGTACGTGTTTIGGVVSLATGLGWVEGNGAAPVMIVPAGKALCLTTSAAVQVSGRVIALQF